MSYFYQNLPLYSHPVYNLYSSSSISTAQSVLWHHSVVVVVVHRRTDSTTLRCLSVSSLSCSAAANIRASRAGPNLDSAQDNACHLYIIILIKVNRAKSKSSIFVVDWLRIRGEQWANWAPLYPVLRCADQATFPVTSCALSPIFKTTQIRDKIDAGSRVSLSHVLTDTVIADTICGLCGNWGLEPVSASELQLL